ncbi:MAG: hypothetical protein NC318_00280 [Blautia sp.]|nr:hypothetical protein [Lachnoclostridium sp.]MCM1210023.1 hypothetical protein [Blautia sp.]
MKEKSSVANLIKSISPQLAPNVIQDMQSNWVIIRKDKRECADLLEAEKKIVCHVYNVDKSKNCNECIKMIMNIKN